ncbi:hypothetical protein ACEWY4_021815 [Coilia grayii]|uniref:TATA box-binding protein-associated factor RNA polymerase I subunit B n=1 Tax=Coilia grayii TaxID=363190 RepID=A0ABD1J489_9TELE
MDDELTGGYNAPCERCAAVDWGVSDSGQFYCKSCHNVIERVQEVGETEVLSVTSRVSSISRSFYKKQGKGLEREWRIIEGFQFVLMHQADALLALGVCPQFKDDVLWNLWQRYLQKTEQAYTENPVSLGKIFIDPSVDSDSAVESVVLSDGSLQSGPSLESELSLGASAGNSSENESTKGALDCGSVDAPGYVRPDRNRKRHLMSMPRTLALCYLALLWAREAITLADLLRFVFEKHIPYLHVHDVFPDEIILYGRDCHVFRVESVPSYRRVQEEARKLAELMALPAFPPVTQECVLHPALLSLRYLTEANLPDELHDWVCRVMEVSGLAKDSALTFDPASKAQGVLHISYDLQACALIIVAMKLLFRLNDNREWVFSENSGSNNLADIPGQGLFSLSLWYETVDQALEKAKKTEKHLTASKSWKSSKTLIFSKKARTVYLKNRRLVEHLKTSFQKLSGHPSDAPPSKPSSLVFRWGEGEDCDGPSFHQTRLDHVTKKESDAKVAANEQYWHPVLLICKERHCKDHYPEVEPTLPRMYVWLLGLFAFLLRVKPSRVHEEVLKVERRFMRCRPRKRKKMEASPTPTDTD